jgi:uncharacterized protein (TIRG00374 family)
MTEAQQASDGNVNPTQASAPAGKLDPKKSIILGVIGIAFIVLIFWKVIPQIGSYQDAWNSLQSMGAAAMILVIVTVLLYLLAYGFPFKAATPGLKFWRSEQVNQAAFAISNGVPAGGAVGLAVQYGMLTSFGITPTASTAAITAVGIWSTFISLGFPILGVVALTLAGGDNTYTALGLLGLGILIVAIVLFVLIMRSEKLAIALGHLGNKLINPLRGRIKALATTDLVPPLTKFRADMYDLLKARWAAITGAQIAVSLTQFLILYVALRGVQGWDNPGTSIIAAFAAFGISQIMLMVPITPGGLGTVDALMITILVSLGATKGDATAADLVWRASSYVPQIIVGIGCLIGWYRKAGEKFAAAK